MPISAVVAGTPHYVLMDGNRRIGPEVAPSHSTAVCVTVYGFSDKGPYDEFRRNSQVALKPYPLVQGYLREQVDVPGGALKLVVVDATGPNERFLHAVTMGTVLEAQANQATQVRATHHLAFDEETNTYRVDEASA